MTRVCMSCQKEFGTAPGPERETTHGLCPPCKERIYNDNDLARPGDTIGMHKIVYTYRRAGLEAAYTFFRGGRLDAIGLAEELAKGSDMRSVEVFRETALDKFTREWSQYATIGEY